MKKDEVIFYVKKGRRYVPHSTYSNQFCDSFPLGTHLVQSYPGGGLRRFNIDPAYAPMIAAGRVAEEAIAQALRTASDLRPSNIPITEEQREAWDRLSQSFGEDIHVLTWPSARDAAESAVKAMQIEADKLLTNPTVRKAYEKFLMVCELTKEHNEQNKT